MYQFWQERLTRYLSWLWADRVRNLDRRYSDGRFGRHWKVGRIRNLSSKNQRERSVDKTKDDELIFPVADVTAKLSGRDYEFRDPTPRRDQTVRSEDFSRELQVEPEESQPTKPTDDSEARAGFWSIQGDFIYRHHNEPPSPYRRKKHSVFHWNTLMLLGLLLLIWTCCKRNELTISGMSIRTDICHIHGEDSRSSLYWKTSFEKEICGPERDSPKCKRLQDQIMYGQKYGRTLVKPLRIEKNRNGQKRNRSSTLLEDWGEFNLSILTTKNTKKISRMREELETPAAPAMPCKTSPRSITKVCAKSENASEKTPKAF